MADNHRRDRERRPARSAAHKQPARRLLVVCEGEVTEPAYLRGYERHVRNATLKLEIPNLGSERDPLRLIRHAQRLSKEATKRARKENDRFLAYDEVWCVFDIDENPDARIRETAQLAAAHGIELAVSNPCFELWLLLHFQESPGAQHRHAVQRMLGTYIPGYNKHLDFAVVEPGLADAARRARRLDSEAEEEGETGRNPSTGVYRLAESISRKEDRG